MPIQDPLQVLQTSLAYQFSKPALLKLALTHRSAGADHNQRLEFLGDATLGLIIADLLFAAWPDESEGQLSQLRAGLVNQEILARLARSLGLSDMLVLGLGERKSGGHLRDSMLSDALEAVIGAIYLDGGYEICRDCVAKLFADSLVGLVPSKSKDAKTRLQEMMQSRGLDLPRYQVTAITGEEHEQLFHVQCKVALLPHITNGTGRSRKLAEQHAAGAALSLLESLSTGNNRGEKL
jgi:ribonuclease III